MHIPFLFNDCNGQFPQYFQQRSPSTSVLPNGTHDPGPGGDGGRMMSVGVGMRSRSASDGHLPRGGAPLRKNALEPEIVHRQTVLEEVNEDQSETPTLTSVHL